MSVYQPCIVVLMATKGPHRAQLPLLIDTKLKIGLSLTKIC